MRARRSKKSRRLLDRLEKCPPGLPGWNKFESICIEILRYLFVPPLEEPKIQPRTYSGGIRRDAVFPNRNYDSANTWGQLLKELQARLILFEFKNFRKGELNGKVVDQASNYLTKKMGNLAIICSRKKPNENARIRRNSVYTEHEKIVIFLDIGHLKEMVHLKDRGQDPSGLIMSMVEDFYLQHE